MKFLLTVVLLGALSQGIVFQTKANDLTRRVFVYFEGQSISSQLFDVNGIFYSIDGNTFNGKCSEIASNGLSDGSLENRLWYIDIPSSAKTSIFSIVKIDSGNQWTSTGYAQLIEGCTFSFNTINYSLQKDSSWKEISISTIEFADYVLSRIDINAFNETDGFMAYPYLKTSFFDELSDYSDAKAKSISWFDESMGRVTTFSEKWSMIGELYESEQKKASFIWWPYAIGAFFLAAALISTMILIRKRLIR